MLSLGRYMTVLPLPFLTISLTKWRLPHTRCPNPSGIRSRLGVMPRQLENGWSRTWLCKHHFTVTRPYGLAYIPEFGVYTYDVRGSNDIRGHGWDTGVWVDGNTGALRQVFLPSGQHSGNTVSTWLWGTALRRHSRFSPISNSGCSLWDDPNRDLCDRSLHLVEKTQREKARSITQSLGRSGGTEGGLTIRECAAAGIPNHLLPCYSSLPDD